MIARVADACDCTPGGWTTSPWLVALLVGVLLAGSVAAAVG